LSFLSFSKQYGQLKLQNRVGTIVKDKVLELNLCTKVANIILLLIPFGQVKQLII